MYHRAIHTVKYHAAGRHLDGEDVGRGQPSSKVARFHRAGRGGAARGCRHHRLHLVPVGAGFADVEVPALRQRLRDQGAIVDYDQAWNDDS